MSKIKSRILGKDPITEKDVVSTYIQVHHIKKITKDKLIALFDVKNNPVRDLLGHINIFFKLAIDAFDNRDLILHASYKDTYDKLTSLVPIIGAFVYDKKYFAIHKSAYDDQDIHLQLEMPEEHTDPLTIVTQSERFAYLFIKGLVSSDQRTLPEHIRKEDFLEFIRSLIPTLRQEDHE